MMKIKFHINPETGDPGRCQADKKCRFASSSEHYSTPEAAREAYENIMKPEPVMYYHMNTSGDPEKCRGKKCRIASSKEHYATPDEAIEAYGVPTEPHPLRTAQGKLEPIKSEPAFQNLPLAQEARIYRILKDQGVEYIPWRGREAELEAAYEPHEVITNEEAYLRGGGTDENTRKVFGLYDKATVGLPGQGNRPNRSEKEAARESIASYRAADALRGSKQSSNSFAVIPAKSEEESGGDRFFTSPMGFLVDRKKKRFHDGAEWLPDEKPNRQDDW
jgi:hypothetical protein